MHSIELFLVLNSVASFQMSHELDMTIHNYRVANYLRIPEKP